MLQSYYRVNTPAVVSESFDDEVIVIDLESGSYYSLGQSGAEIWRLLEHGTAVTAINTKLAALYQLSPTEIAAATQPFIAALEAEHLIIIEPTPLLPTNGATTSLVLPSTTFVPPVLTKFTDMQELLLLDPIHDVDETGWPKPKAL